METPKNRAAWLKTKKARPFEIADAEMPVPGPDEVVMRIHAVAINPVDHAIQAHGIIDEIFPVVLGVDAAGVVHSVGADVKDFQPGDRVLGIVDHDVQNQHLGSFQLYARTKPLKLAGRLPASVSFADAAVLPLALCTAAVALFQTDTLALPHPRVDTPPTNITTGGTMVIWGGSSSLGSCGIQMAKAAGMQVAAVAGAHNADYCRDLGADFFFDRASATITEDIVAALKGRGTFAGSFVAVMDEQAYFACANVAIALGGAQLVASVLPPAMPYEKPLPGGVRMCYDWGSSLQHNEVGPAVWSWVTPALESGQLRCKPNATVVGQGLEKLQEAVDKLAQPVSATKYVVEFP